MSHQYINEYIKNYIENDKSQSAIMLNAAWGCGKSYYIQNELVPFLEDPENGSHECIIISLYGLPSIYDISKSVFLEIRSKRLPKLNEKAVTTGKLFAKTIIKGVTSHFSIDLSLQEDELRSFYETVDLHNKILIFEDIERSKIDIQELWGYINNLVEQDGAKVLLVANEEKYLQYETKIIHDQTTGKDTSTKEFTKESLEYLTTKEKTVSDTIAFHCDYSAAIKNILDNYQDQLGQFSTPEEIENLRELLIVYGIKNLRTFIFACQKTADLLRKTGSVLIENKRCIFYSIIAFAKALKSGVIPAWEGNDYISVSLGMFNYPLYRFCYDYIVWQQFDQREVQKSFDAHKELILFNKHGSANDEDVNLIYSYSIHTEDEVLKCLKRIEIKLQNAEEIAYYDYGKLAYYLARFSLLLDFDYTRCVESMSQNIKGKQIDAQLLFWPFDNFDSEEHRNRFNQIKNNITMALQAESEILNQWDYAPANIEEFHELLVSKENEILTRKRFISYFDTKKLVECVFSCDASQLDEFRGILSLFYRLATPINFEREDCESLQRLLDQIIDREHKEEERIEKGERNRFDRIVLTQIEWLKSNLADYIERMS